MKPFHSLITNICANESGCVNPKGVRIIQPRVGESASLPWVLYSNPSSTLKGLQRFRLAPRIVSNARIRKIHSADNSEKPKPLT